jgi:hypothetical protein
MARRTEVRQGQVPAQATWRQIFPEVQQVEGNDSRPAGGRDGQHRHDDSRRPLTTIRRPDGTTGATERDHGGRPDAAGAQAEVAAAASGETGKGPAG